MEAAVQGGDGQLCRPPQPQLVALDRPVTWHRRPVGPVGRARWGGGLGEQQVGSVGHVGQGTVGWRTWGTASGISGTFGAGYGGVANLGNCTWDQCGRVRWVADMGNCKWDQWDLCGRHGGVADLKNCKYDQVDLWGMARWGGGLGEL